MMVSKSNLHFCIFNRDLLTSPSRMLVPKREVLWSRGEVVPPLPILEDDFTLLQHPRATRGTRHAAQTSCEVINMQRTLVWAKQFQETQQLCSRKHKNKDRTQMIWSEITVLSLGAHEAARYHSRTCGSATERLGKERCVDAAVQGQAMTVCASLNENTYSKAGLKQPWGPVCLFKGGQFSWPRSNV